MANRKPAESNTQNEYGNNYFKTFMWLVIAFLRIVEGKWNMCLQVKIYIVMGILITLLGYV